MIIYALIYDDYQIVGIYTSCVKLAKSFKKEKQSELDDLLKNVLEDEVEKRYQDEHIERIKKVLVYNDEELGNHLINEYEEMPDYVQREMNHYTVSDYFLDDEEN